MLEQYLTTAPGGRRGRTIKLNGAPTYGELVELGKQISFTERRADDAERELRQVKVLELLVKKVGEDFPGVVTGITNFGIFVQITTWLIDGLIRYEDLMDDWWEVDDRGGFIRGQRTGNRIRIGDTATVRIVRVDPARRELGLAVIKLHSRSETGEAGAPEKPAKQHRKGKVACRAKSQARGGGKVRRNRR